MEEDVLLARFCCVVDLPPFRFAGNPGLTFGSGVDSLEVGHMSMLDWVVGYR